MTSSHRISLAGLAAAAILLAASPSRAAAPSGRFTVADGTVTDSKTGLVWQQVAGTTTYAWADAQNYCQLNVAALPGTGWTLPTVKQLQSIVDDRASNPSVDTTYFPATPADYFWSATALGTGVSWYVDFSSGGSSNADVSSLHYVRCVR